MSSNEFINNLIAELQADGVKSAAADDKSKKDDKKDDKKEDKKDERENAFRERMKGKKDDKDDKKKKDKDDKKGEEKKASVLPGTDFDVLAGLEGLPEDLRKLASAAASAEFMADMARQKILGTPRATAPVDTQKQATEAAGTFDASTLFNEVFELHTAKLAQLDPAYGALLEAEQEKMAFNQGYADAVKAAQQRLQPVNPFAQMGGF